MKVVTILVLIIASSKACYPVPKHHVFKCPAPNGRGLQGVFEKFWDLRGDFVPKWKGMDSVVQVNNWFYSMVYENLEKVSATVIYKNLISFICDNMYVDAEFYVNNTRAAIIAIGFFNHEVSGQLPKEKYREEFANHTDYIRRSALGVGIDRLLHQAVYYDRYAQLAMDHFTSPHFQAIMDRVLSLPQLRPFRRNLKRYKINETDVIYLYTRLALSCWIRG